jgi:hypothetical protein
MSNRVPLFIMLSALLSCSTADHKQQNNVVKSEVKDWKSEVESTLNLYGHRNWIVIADGAYPQQSNPAIKTIKIDADQLEAVEFVFQLIEKAKHVDANIIMIKKWHLFLKRTLMVSKPIEQTLIKYFKLSLLKACCMKISFKK